MMVSGKMVFLVCSLSSAITAGRGTLTDSALFGAPPLVKPGAPGEKSQNLSVSESLALAETSFTAEDVAFMQAMITHHSQAVDMAALIAERTRHPGITQIGKRISLSQSAEIDMMTTWLKRRGQSTQMQDTMMHHHSGGHHNAQAMTANTADTADTADTEGSARIDPLDIAVMGGMLTPRQMEALAASQGLEFERRFLTGMIEHHKGAIDMVNGLARAAENGNDPELSDFMASIVADQTAEIARMQRMLADLETAPTP